jgi:hypothetical protein
MKPGDKLWLVARNHRNHEITVAKIGRKWATTDNRRWRLNMETMQVFDGDYRVGMAYPSEQAYRDQEAVRDAWSEFQRLVARKSSEGMSVEQIDQAAAWLGVGA